MFVINMMAYILMSMTAITVTAKKDQVTLLFVGDISFSGPVKYYVEHKYHTYNDSFNEVAPHIRQADISIGNLESPFVSQDVYRHMYKGKKTVILDASPEAAPALSFAGFDVVTLANNHLNDFGSEGVDFTVDVLKKTGVKHFGVTYGKYDASQDPLILERRGIRIGFLGYCDSLSINKNCTEMRMLFNSGPAVYRDDIATRDVNKLKQAKVDIIVVFMHYGQERSLGPRPYQHRINKHLMSLGVHMIIGSHPHVLQPHCVTEDNKLIANSLGNFLFQPNRPMGGNNPEVYGRLGHKPNKLSIESYERFVLESCENLKASRMLKVTVSRNGIVGAKYLPLKIAFDPNTKRIHPEPKNNAKWIIVCGVEDKECQPCHKS